MEQVGHANRDSDLTVLSSSTSGRRTRTARGRAAPSTDSPSELPRHVSGTRARRRGRLSEVRTEDRVDRRIGRRTNLQCEPGPCARRRVRRRRRRRQMAVACAGRRRRLTKSYLVDPASSYMLVSKIKPCMSKYIPRHGETANGSLNRSLFIGSFILLG